MRYQILLAEDDADLGVIVSDYLTGASGGELSVTWKTDGPGAAEAVDEAEFDLAILDVMLPGMSGFELCRRLREKSDAPVLFLTARCGEEDKLHAYGLGADDYLVKPFSLAELLARCRALIRRSKGLVRGPCLAADGLTLDPDRGEVRLEGKPIELPPKEYALLKLFLERQGKLLSRETLLVRVWGWDFEGSDRVVDSHIKKLRRALGPWGRHLKTVVKSGYKLEVNDHEENGKEG